jgi:phosphatidate phosphatase APP1
LKHRSLIAAIALLAACKSSCGERPARLVLFDGYGTPAEVHLFGRVIADKGLAPTSSAASAIQNLGDSWLTLETDEIPDATVEIELDGRRFEARTDDDGRFTVIARGTERPFPVGRAELVGRVARGATAPAASAIAFVLSTDGGRIVVSDVDDTIVETGVKDGARMIESALLKNALQVAPVPGVARAYGEALGAGAEAIIYLSGSPHSFHDRIALFMKHHGIPRGPIILKNFGEDALLAQEGYKLSRLRTLFALFPRHSFVLVGDSGEKDPEIYAAARSEAPGRVLGVIIRRAPGGDHREDRFPEMTLVDAYEPTVIAQLVATSTRT